MPIAALTLAVVGLDFPNERGPARRFELALIRPGEPVELRPEPRNPADPRAVGVWSARGVRLGFLSAERCGWIGGMIRDGREVRAAFQGTAGRAAFVRVAFDGAEPVLPTVGPAGPERADDGFWPDEPPSD